MIRDDNGKSMVSSSTSKTVRTIVSWKLDEIKIPQEMQPSWGEVQRNIQSFSDDGVLDEIIVNDQGWLIEGINAYEAAVKLGQEQIYCQTIPTEKPQLADDEMLLSEIQIHPCNVKIYGNEDLFGLRESLRNNGQREKIILIPVELSHFKDKVLDQSGYFPISGNSRAAAAAAEGWLALRYELITEAFPSPEAELEALLDSNTYRVKSNYQKVQELLLYEEIERAKTRARQGRVGQGTGETVTDIVAKKVGWSRTTYDHAKHVVSTIDQTATAAPNSFEHNLHWKLRQAFTKSVDGAYKLIKPENEPKSSGKSKAPFKIGDRVAATAGEFKGAIGTIWIIVSNTREAMVEFEHLSAGNREKVPFAHLQLIPAQSQKSTNSGASAEKELGEKQQELGLGKSKGNQVLPDVKRPAEEPEEHHQSTTLAANEIADVQVEAAFRSILKLRYSQMLELCKKFDQLSLEQIKALAKGITSNLDNMILSYLPDPTTGSLKHLAEDNGDDLADVA
jgi:ribosomal protein L24